VLICASLAISVLAQRTRDIGLLPERRSRRPDGEWLAHFAVRLLGPVVKPLVLGLGSPVLWDAALAQSVDLHHLFQANDQ
jgi:hypothetical protein